MFDVTIVGCGPVGALAANFLGLAGLKVLVVEKEAVPYPLPRAVHIDHEMMRLFQASGVVNHIEPDVRDTEGHLHIGADKGVIRYMGTRGKPRPYGWSNDYFFFQPELEEHLRSALVRFENVDVRYGHEFVELSQQDACVNVHLRNDEGIYTQETRWVIACDGARSTVRKSLGVTLEDLDFEEPWLVVDAEVEGPVRFGNLTGVPENADLQNLSVMMCDPARPATIVPGRGNHRRWEFMLLPGESDEEMQRPEKVAELLKPWLDGVPHKVTRAATYRFHGLIAKQWQVGNVFLAGDAAHQTPPFFGQGMCHGFRDVVNLAWKMALVKNGECEDSLLMTYQPERDPHVRSVISSAVEAGRYICVLDTAVAAARDAEIRAKAQAGALPTPAGNLIPAIVDGVVATETSRAGERFIQPRIETEQGFGLLDNMLPYGWQIFVANERLATTARQVCGEYAHQLGINVTNAASLNDQGALLRWLDEAGANMVLVRPDFYVFGTADNADELIMQLIEKLHFIGDAQSQAKEKIA